MNSDSNDETIFPHKLCLTDRQDSRPRIAFANNLLANKKLLNIKFSNIMQSGEISADF